MEGDLDLLYLGSMMENLKCIRIFFQPKMVKNLSLILQAGAENLRVRAQPED